ncbi:hypothetical protein C5167_027874 [Papaver somniferum]|nr:hypothetical protein C5167_027874 [Papaver somniferum]
MLLQLSLTSIISSLTKTPPQAKILFLLTTYHHHSTLSLKSSKVYGSLARDGKVRGKTLAKLDKKTSLEGSDYLCPVMKYSALYSNDWTLGLSPHTDQDLITVLYEKHTKSLDQRKNACNQTQSNGEGEKKDSRLNATTSSKGKMLLEYWIVIPVWCLHLHPNRTMSEEARLNLVQGFKQRATGNMDDPYLIPGWCCEVGYFVVVVDLQLE